MTEKADQCESFIRALIVDDEYPARAELRYHLDQHDDVEVTGEAATAREAIRLIDALRYDVIFVDIAMPGLSGIELAQRLMAGPQSPPYVIFVTAYDDFAIKAFEIRALDYILKPINAQRVGESLSRLRDRLTDQPTVAPMATDPHGSLPRTQWIMGIRDETSIPIPLNSVTFATSEGDQVYVYTRNERYLTRHTLRDLEQVLPSGQFFRCHRGYIVNLRFVLEISPFFNGTYTLTVPKRPGVTSIPVSRSRVSELKRFFWPHS